MTDASIVHWPDIDGMTVTSATHEAIVKGRRVYRVRVTVTSAHDTRSEEGTFSVAPSVRSVVLGLSPGLAAALREAELETQLSLL